MIPKALTALCLLSTIAFVGCGGASAASGVDKKPIEPHCEPPDVGQMTEQAAQAKRLYDAGKWVDAANVFKWIAQGSTGDDQGNRQIAAYHRGIALYRAGQHAESRAQFESIAATTCHLKQKEAERWLRDPEQEAKK